MIFLLWYDINFVLSNHSLLLLYSIIENKTIFSYFEVIGGWANNRTLIRRKRQDEDMTTEYTFNSLQKDNPLKVQIEITTGTAVNHK